MRISDWSSDVCSSDLKRSRRSRCIQPWDVGFQSQQDLCRGPHLDCAQRGCCDSSCQGVHTEWGGGIPLRGYVYDHQLNDRSEEHTSEIQSLMRISYDVICLITKHDHIDNNHT